MMTQRSRVALMLAGLHKLARQDVGRPSSEKVRGLLAKGMHHPDQLTDDEIRELCTSVMHQLFPQ